MSKNSKEQGAGLLCMEMVSAKGIFYNNKNTESLLQIHPEEVPVSLQFFGSDPKIVSEMAKDVYKRQDHDRNAGIFSAGVSQ